MRPGPTFRLKATTPFLLAALLLAAIGPFSLPVAAQEGAGDIEHPADIAPDGAEMAPEDEAIAPDKLNPPQPKMRDRSFMRPDLRGDGKVPPRSAEESKQDKLSPPAAQMPLPSAEEKPKLLAQLYERLSKARDAEASVPIIELIEHLWRVSGSDTVDLLTERAERLAKADDLDLALKIIDATVDIAPEQAEAWHLRAKVHYLKKEYEIAIADLRQALSRDPKHYGAMNDLGVVLEAIGAKKEALEAYRKALKVNPFLIGTKQAAEELAREVEGQDI
jgi:tetratricopeptide (TPR) repeat protein